MKKKNNSYLLGIIGALVGGLIGTIPWILLYVYANMIYSLLALVVAVAALKGYELLKGKVDNKLPFIIGGASVIAITIATLVIIPNLLVLKEGWTISLANYQMLFENSEFTSAIIRDYVMSLLFTFLGISGVISSIKKQVNNGSEKIDLNYTENKISEEEHKKVKEVFVKYNALDKNNAISKDILWRETSENEYAINYLVSQGFIKIKKDNYYYNEKAENTKNKKMKSVIIFVVLIIFVFMIGIFTSTTDDTNNKESNNKVQETETREVSFDIPKGYQEIDDEEGNGWYYVPKNDLSWESGSILVDYYTDDYLYEDFDLVKENLKEYFEEENYEVKSVENSINDKGYNVVSFVLEIEEYREIIHYVFNGKKYAIIDGIDYYDTENSTIQSTSSKIAKSFGWNE